MILIDDNGHCYFDGKEELLKAQLGTLVSTYRHHLVKDYHIPPKQATAEVSKVLIDALVISETIEGEKKSEQSKKNSGKGSD